MSIQIAPRPVAAVKAALGSGVTALTYDTPLWQTARNPQRLARQAVSLYHENMWVHKAEGTVSGKAAGLPWHLEDENDDEVTDESPQALVAIRDLFERPQNALPVDQRQPQASSWRTLRKITNRHMGLCGTAFWYLDQSEALAGTPLAILYLAPWRLYEVTNKAGSLLGWTLDKPPEEGGTPLELERVIAFYLDPPDEGNFGIGIVESVGTRVYLDNLSNRHMSRVFASGGRLTGIVSPKQGTQINDDQWAQFVRDYRGIVEDPDAAKRLQIVKGPVDFARTSATSQELAVVEVSKLTRDDILSAWGVPQSQASIAGVSGLNSGERQGYDEATLMQGAVHDRVTPFVETVQFQLLDRFKGLGISVELVIEEPEFDDDKPAYEKAQASLNLPLRNRERRAILGLDPLGDPVQDEAVWLPSGVIEAFVAPDEQGNLLTPIQAVEVPQIPALLPAKASVHGSLVGLRARIDAKVVPQLRAAVRTVLAEQKREIVARTGHIVAKPNDRTWWNGAHWDERLRKALAPHTQAIVATVAPDVARIVRRPGKADGDIVSVVNARLLAKLGDRIKGINDTTREGIASLISDGIDAGDTATELADRLEGWAGFDEYRSELIARTESMFAYNDAALGTYGEYGVGQVQAIDGDQDEECAARNGQTFTLEEAEGIEDHPNGTLDWVPVVESL